MKQVIKLTETKLRNIIKESVLNIINEIGDTDRGKYMLGRADYRAYKNNDSHVRNNIYDTMKKYKNDYQAFDKGFDDESNDVNYRNKKFNYNSYETSDMDKLGKKFINFIETYNGGVLLQMIADYESGNQNGVPSSPIDELIYEFEDNVLGRECTPKMKKAIERAYNEWWYYAESEILGDNI